MHEHMNKSINKDHSFSLCKVCINHPKNIETNNIIILHGGNKSSLIVYITFIILIIKKTTNICLTS